nr:MAG TPA: hypothetical protein [Caudoviricetes sp.]
MRRFFFPPPVFPSVPVPSLLYPLTCVNWRASRVLLL